MTEEEAISLAQKIAEEEGWPWRDQVIVTKNKRWRILGPQCWWIITKAPMRPVECVFKIDDKTGRVIWKRFFRPPSQGTP